MTKRIACPLILAIFAGSLAACSTTDKSRYPSLALRDVERITGSAQPVDAPPVPAPVTPSAQLSERLAQLKGEAQGAHDQFMGALPRTEQLVSAASGAAVASESWSVAQSALGGLEAARNPALVALAELDELYVKSEMEVGAVEAIEVARDSVKALVAVEEQALDRLVGRTASQ